MNSWGKLTGQRMLPPEGFRPKFETSVESRGTILGIISTIVATYWSVLRPDGKLYGENPGQGMLMTGDGDTALFRGAGLGQLAFPILARGGRTCRCQASLALQYAGQWGLEPARPAAYPSMAGLRDGVTLTRASREINRQDTG
jgi:hypothetical protein